MRDAFSRGNVDGARQVVAVGDGAAVFDPATGAWRVQIGLDLSGLRALHMGDEGLGEGWAVGERTRLARLDANNCWVADDSLINGSVSLASIIYEGSSRRGWAVGRRGLSGVLLRLRVADDTPTWSDATGLVSGGLPPLSDFSLSNLGPPVHDAWLVSPVAHQLLRARLGTTPDGESDVAEVTQRVVTTAASGELAWPREIAMRHDEGWVVGEAPMEERGRSMESWRHLGDAVWRPEFEERSGAVVDLYFDNSQLEGRWWLGMTPGERGGVLRTTEKADGSQAWEHWDPSGPEDAGARASGGHSAIAPLGDGHMMYGWGDQVWVYDHSVRQWGEVLQRRSLVGVAPHRAGAWALAATQSSGPRHSTILSWDGSALRPVDRLDGQVGGPLNLTAIDSGGGAAWAVGERGETFRQRGATGWWQAMPRPENVAMLSDVAVAADGSAWAVGLDSRGHHGLWFFDEFDRAWRRAVDTERLLQDVVALPGGRAWAVGDGVACECTPDACACEEGLHYIPAPGEPSVELAFRAVAATEAGPIPEVWASGDHDGTSYLVRRGDNGWRDAPAFLLGSLPRGATVVDLVAGGPDDMWSLATCHPYPDKGRGVTIVNHFRGAADAQAGRIESLEALALSVPASRLAVHDTGELKRTVWLAGDWSSLLSLSYDAGSEPAGLHPPPVPDLRCAPAYSEQDLPTVPPRR